ncbi:GTP-binding protein HSR1-related protein [Sulfobacillus acidophilus TPY]|uniref:GTP-binding protein HSR1-related protein n=1 Tax=Sulfobacillus acidophilus (strain ATCC 700253 / DSM 10332 / NAL) TaxID=679936 RepID=G8U082_SULAD|nr:GTP-binding protein HSR1-related protein [Sulfobacillus acidophilus TPY]AEW05331.1 GTP-binding protein HSR1-related protein [Sulfobacillus acidophilus DSM 10332]
MEALIVGRPNVGKTLLALNFAQYVGHRDIRWLTADEGGEPFTRRLWVERARRELVSPSAPKTRRLQTFQVELRDRRHPDPWAFIDTVGLDHQISEDPQVRQQIAMTLERMARSPVVLHVVDAHAVTRYTPEEWGTDDALVAYCRARRGYTILANKMDKTGADRGYRVLRERYRGLLLISVSAITHQGFRELKQLLTRRNW